MYLLCLVLMYIFIWHTVMMISNVGMTQFFWLLFHKTYIFVSLSTILHCAPLYFWLSIEWARRAKDKDPFSLSLSSEWGPYVRACVFYHSQSWLWIICLFLAGIIRRRRFTRGSRYSYLWYFSRRRFIISVCHFVRRRSFLKHCNTAVSVLYCKFYS